MKYGFTILVLVLIAGAAWAMTDYIIPMTWRYKITVEIETPEGIKVGSTVREVKAWRNLVGALPDAPEMEYEIIGEAVVIDLGERGILFRLVGSHDEIYKAFPKKSSKKFAYYSKLKHGQMGEITEYAERFYMFPDINDPYSIETVLVENFSDILGDTVKLKKVQIEMTDEKPTFGRVIKFLSWFDDKPMGLKRWDAKQQDKAKYLTKSSFIKGEKQ